jgi:hypothetical protein
VQNAEQASLWAGRNVAFVETDHIAELAQHEDFRDYICRYD